MNCLTEPVDRQAFVVRIILCYKKTEAAAKVFLKNKQTLQIQIVR
jgi:hypothetical protein